MYQNLALIVPTTLESEFIISKINPIPEKKLHTVFKGKLYNKNIYFIHCGIGKVNAAHSITLILEKYDIDLIILFGICGAYLNTDLKIGDIVIAEKENYAEEGILLKDGWKPMQYLGFLEHYNTFLFNDKLIKDILKILKQSDFEVYVKNFVTVSQCSGTKKAGEIIQKRFNAHIENTEGAAIKHISDMYNKDMIEIRGVSNIIEERDKSKWNIKLATLRCNNAVLEIIRRI